MLEPRKDKLTIAHDELGLMVSIETAHLVIRSIREGDRQHYVDLFADKDSLPMYASGETRSADSVNPRIDLWLNRWKTYDPFSALSIFEAPDKFIGFGIIGHGEQPGESECAILITKSATRQGYGGEIASLFNRFAYELVKRDNLKVPENIPPLNLIYATSRVDNAPMITLLERMGFSADKGKINLNNKWGQARFIYGMDKDTVVRLHDERDTQTSKQASPEPKDRQTIQKMFAAVMLLLDQADDQPAFVLGAASSLFQKFIKGQSFDATPAAHIIYGKLLQFGMTQKFFEGMPELDIATQKPAEDDADVLAIFNKK